MNNIKVYYIVLYCIILNYIFIWMEFPCHCIHVYILHAVKRYNNVLIWLTDCDSINVMMNISIGREIYSFGATESGGEQEWGKRCGHTHTHTISTKIEYMCDDINLLYPFTKSANIAVMNVRIWWPLPPNEWSEWWMLISL